MAVNQDIDKLNNQESELRDKFLEDQPSYEKLAKEVKYTLRKRLNEANIEYSAVTHRAKTLNSYLKKCLKKPPLYPEREITDLAGVRIVYLYKNDLDKITKIIDDEFKILETVDKLEEQAPDRFGYGAVHYIVQLGLKSTGARYDDLKALCCEIQVRTVMQDAWAIISHHLDYKRKADIPKHFKRKLFSLSGLFEVADDQFNSIRNERDQFAEELKKSSVTEDDFLNQEINIDTVTALLKKRFPNRKLQYEPIQMSFVLGGIDKRKYTTINDLSTVLRRTQKAIAEYLQYGFDLHASVEILSLSIAIADNKFRQTIGLNKDTITRIKHVERLLED